MEVKSYLSRVLAPIGGFRVSPCNFDGGPHADTPAHYPSAPHKPYIRALGECTITCFECKASSNTTEATNAVSHYEYEPYRTAPHYLTWSHQRHSRTRSPAPSDDHSTNWPGLWITTTAKGSSSGSARWRTAETAERARYPPIAGGRTGARGRAAATLAVAPICSSSRRTTLLPSCFEGCRVTHERSQVALCCATNAQHTVWHQIAAHSLSFCSRLPIARFARPVGVARGERRDRHTQPFAPLLFLETIKNRPAFRYG